MEFKLNAEKRNILGRKSGSLRKQGITPGIVYGHEFEPIPVQLNSLELEKSYRDAGESTIVGLKIDGTEYPVLIHDVSIDPISEKIAHVDFYKVKMTEKLEASIKLVFVGESDAVKNFGAILVKNLNEIEVEALPADLPHEIEIDLSKLKNIGEDILVKDLKLSDKVEVLTNPDEVIATVQEPRKEEVVEAEVAPTVEDVEVIKKEVPVEEAAE